MQFRDASSVEEIVYSMRLADIPRGRIRALTNDLANGAPPYSPEEARLNNIEINSNDLGLTRLSHDARQQFYGAFTKPGAFFTARTDMGTKHLRTERGVIVTKEVNRIMKKSVPYFELLRSKFAMDVLHGIGPSVWENRTGWCGDARGIEDILLPSGTRLTMKNVPFIAIFCSWTPRELIRLTRGPHIDPGWDMDNVNAAIKWSDEQTSKLQTGTVWADQWSPEKASERQKENSGIYASDIVQTIDAWDFYFWNDEKKESGWSRKIVLDAEGGYQAWAKSDGRTMPGKNLLGDRNRFLYDGGTRKYASDLSEIVHFQFADLSAVAPFRYHSVRSLGFMLYEVCHLQNRMHCKFSEAVLETLMPYFRVNSSDDVERALKISMASRGVIDESVHFLTAAERWQVNHVLAEMGMQMNQRIIDQNSSSFVQNQSYSQDRTEKTKFQVMAEVNAMTTLINAALQQAYFYQTGEFYEDFRRFMLPDSDDPEVKQFQARCMKRGVPAKMMVAEAWELEPERVMGSGNKAMEMAIAQQLMTWLGAYSPAAQEMIKKVATLAVTDDAALTALLLPETPPQTSASQHIAMSSIGTLMQGGRYEFGDTVNRVEVVEILLVEMKLIVDRMQQMGPLTTIQEVLGVQNMAQTVGKLIGELGQDPGTADKVKRYSEALNGMMKTIEGIAQQLQAAQEQQGAAGGQPQMDPKDMAKIQGMQMLTAAKAENLKSSGEQKRQQSQEKWADKQAQGQVSHDERLKQDQEKHGVDLQKKIAELKAELQVKELEHASGLAIQKSQAEMDAMNAVKQPKASE